MSLAGIRGKPRINETAPKNKFFPQIINEIKKYLEWIYIQNVLNQWKSCSI